VQRIDARVQPRNGRYFELLRREIPAGRSVLDVGCGTASPVLHVEVLCSRYVGVDRHAPALMEAKERRPTASFVVASHQELADVFRPGSFEVVVALDFIEHLPKPDALVFLDLVERLATERVVIFTPNGFLEQRPYEGNPWQEHLCGFSTAEMRARGYRVIGVNGFKPLRGERAEPRFRPYVWTKRLSLATTMAVENRPTLAFQLLCVKDIAGRVPTTRRRRGSRLPGAWSGRSGCSDPSSRRRPAT
jgi:SAM-dependent methyltransferase